MIAVKNGHLNCVKLLIGHGADLSRVPTPRSHPSRLTKFRQGAAEKAGHHPEVDAYIQECLKDLKGLNTTRAHLEKSRLY